MTPQSTPATDDDSLVLSALWGALRVFRVLALVYALWSIWVRHAEMARLDLALMVIGVLSVWTAYMYVSRRRDLRIHVMEMVLASAAVMSTRWFDTPLSATTGDTTIPGVWQNVPVVAIALILGWRGGLIASLVITAVMIAQVGQFDSEPLSNAGLIVMLGTCLGFGADVARTEQAELRRALARQAEVAERDRLARVVHDGVLQALAFIHRRGRDIGGESARLGMIAAEQELRLRALVIGMPLPELEVAIAGPVDLRRALDAAVTDSATLVASRSSWTPPRPRKSSPPSRPPWTTSANMPAPKHRRGWSSTISELTSSSRCATTARGSPRTGSPRRPRAGDWACRPQSRGGSRTSADEPVT